VSGEPDSKRPLGRSNRRWEDNIIMEAREMVWEIVDWNRLAEDRDQWRTLVNTITKSQFP